MAKKVLVKATLQEAGNVKTVWESNPGFTLGKTGLNDFIAVYPVVAIDVHLHGVVVEGEVIVTAPAVNGDAFNEGCVVVNAFGIDRVREQRDDKARELSILITRFRSAVRGAYGPDSAEYSQAGGTRTSARKSPTRKPNTTATPQA